MMAWATGCPPKVSGMIRHPASSGMYSTVNRDTATWLSLLWLCSPRSWLKEDSRRAPASVCESLSATASDRRLPRLSFMVADSATSSSVPMMHRASVMMWCGE